MIYQVGHNLGESDYISVLLSIAIRISHSLNIHRVGPDRENTDPNGNSDGLATRLIEREVKKRVWWFIIRQDWLQIPFQNTYMIHASQFNTPMPLNCFDDERMIQDGKVVVQPDSTFTLNSYSNFLHEGESPFS
jgi:hypothetical protein